MKYIIWTLCLLTLLLTGCSLGTNSWVSVKSAPPVPQSDELSKLKSWKHTIEKDIEQKKNERRGWNKRICDTTLASCGKSPMGFTHTVPGQDPTIVSGWRDPITKDSANDDFIEAKSQVDRLNDTIKAAEKELAETNRKIEALECTNSGGNGGSGGGSGGGGGGY